MPRLSWYTRVLSVTSSCSTTTSNNTHSLSPSALFFPSLSHRRQSRFLISSRRSANSTRSPPSTPSTLGYPPLLVFT